MLPSRLRELRELERVPRRTNEALRNATRAASSDLESRLNGSDVVILPTRKTRDKRTAVGYKKKKNSAQLVPRVSKR